MRRREFIALLGSAAAIRPLGARAERPLKRILYFTYLAGYRHEANWPQKPRRPISDVLAFA